MKLSDVFVDGNDGGQFDKERQQFACLIAFYIGQLSEGDLDSFKIMDKCVRFAKLHDFDLEKPIHFDDPEEEILLSAESARHIAYEFAKDVIKNKGY